MSVSVAGPGPAGRSPGRAGASTTDGGAATGVRAGQEDPDGVVDRDRETDRAPIHQHERGGHGDGEASDEVVRGGRRGGAQRGARPDEVPVGPGDERGEDDGDHHVGDGHGDPARRPLRRHPGHVVLVVAGQREVQHELTSAENGEGPSRGEGPGRHPHRGDDADEHGDEQHGGRGDDRAAGPGVRPHPEDDGGGAEQDPSRRRTVSPSGHRARL